MSPTFYPTSSPSLSSAPSQSSAPTEAPTAQADRLNTGDSLMINAMELVNGDGKIETSATSSNFGSRSAYLGSLISFVITAWLYY